MPRTTIVSDWKSYKYLTVNTSSEDFQHLTANHSYNFVDSDCKNTGKKY